MNYDKTIKQNIKNKYKKTLSNTQLNSFYNLIKNNDLEKLKKLDLQAYCQKNKSHGLFLAIKTKNIDIIKLLIPYSNLQDKNLNTLKVAIETNDDVIIDLIIKNTKKLHKAFIYTIEYENKFSFDKIINLLDSIDINKKSEAFFKSINCKDRYFFEELLKKDKSLLITNLEYCVVESFKNEDNHFRDKLLKLKPLDKLNDLKLNFILKYLIDRNKEDEIIELIKIIKNVYFHTIKDSLIKNDNINILKHIKYFNNVVENKKFDYSINIFFKDKFEHIIKNKQIKQFGELLEYLKTSHVINNINFLKTIQLLLKNDKKSLEQFIDFYLNNATIKDYDIFYLNEIYKNDKKSLYDYMFKNKNIIQSYFITNTNLKNIDYEGLLDQIIKKNKVKYIKNEIKNIELKDELFEDFKNNLLKLTIEKELKEEVNNSISKNKRKI